LSFKKCALKAGISSEDMAEIRSHIQRAGNDAQGVQDYLDGIDADLNDLRNQTGTQLVTEQVTTPGQAITGEVVEMIRGLKPDALNQAKAQGYEGDSPIESKEWLAALKKFGPEGMTHEARMARAEAMGFDTGTTYYHGTSRTPGEGITEFKSTKWDGVAGYFTEDPDFASVSAEFGPNPTVYPVYIRNGRALDLTSLGDSEGITHKEIIDKLKAEGVDFSESTVMDVPQHPISGGQPVWSYLARNDLINSIKNSGFDGIDFKEMGELDTQKLLDTGVESAKPTSNHIALKAENIRSINAAFDPDFKDSPLLLAQSQQAIPDEIGQEARDKILNKNNVDRGLKVPKSARFWRGIGENSGSAGATYGTGLYVARSKAEAKEYAGKTGKLHEMDRSDLPQDPLRFETINDYQIWLQRSIQYMGMNGPRDFNAKYPDVKDFIQALDPDLDGMQIGTGADSIFVNYGGRKVFDQEGETEPQGQIAILPESAIIKLYNSANLSTFLHESAHLFLHMTGKLYSHPKASERIKTDGVAILKYLGAESFDTITTEQHEAWARGMEKYFGEGKAPSLELQGAFRRFSQWIKSVYTSLVNLNVELTDDIREVMDRMLATDEQIDRLKGNFKPIFKDAEDAEMTKAEFKAYDGNASPDAAKEELLKNLIKELRRKEEKWWKDEKFNIQTQVIKELEKTPVYSAEKYLREPESIPIVQTEAQAQIQVLEDAAADLYKKNDTVLTFVAKAGGLNRADFKSQGIDEENFKIESRVFGKPVFPKEGGLTADGVAEAYNEINNTNITANDAFELVQDSLSEDAFISGEVEAEHQKLLNDAQEIRFQYGGLGSNRLLTSEVKQIIPGRIPRRLAGMVSKFGSSAEQLAPMFGFASGSEMITSLAESKTIKQQSSDVAEAEMMGRHGDALHDGRIEEEAEQAMRNDSRAKKLLAELRSLSKKTRTQAIDRASLREYARAKIAKMKVNSISPSQFLAAEIRAARAAAVAKSKGDNDGAQKAKTQEIINFYLGKEAFLAKDKAEKIRSAHKVISNKSYDSNKINTEYVSKAKIIIAAFDYRKTSRGTAEKHKAELEAARLWIESQQVDAEKASPFLVQAEILGRLIPYYDMTVEDLTGLDDTITSLMKAGRETSIQKTEQFKAEMDELGDHINKNRIKEYNSDLDNSKSFSWGGKLYHGAAASLRTMGSLARQIDGMNEQGAFYQKVVKPLNDAANKELVMKKQSGLALREVFKGYDGVLGSTITGDTVISLKNKIKEKAGFNVADKMMTFRFDSGQVHRMSYGGRISVVLNMGNAGNYEALTNMNEFPITKRDLDQILNSLTDQDLDLIQNIWDYINTFWKEAAELEKSRSGVAPVKVEAQSFTTPKGRVMKGGYFPLVEDKGATAKTSDIEAQDARSRRGTAVANATKSGSLIERTKFGGRKISFNINNVFDHIDEIIHDLSHWQAVHDVSKVLENKRVKAEITKSVGVEGVVAINQRLAEVSAGAPKMEGLGSIERMFRHARLAVTYNALGFAVSTGLKNLAGFTVAAAEVGGGNLTVSLASFLESPSESTKFILKKSEYMSNRGEVINKDIAFARSQIRSDGKLDNVRSASFVFVNLADQLVTRSTWLAAYSLAESKYDIKTEEARIDYADDVVRRTQGSGEALSQSNIMTRNEIMRVATIMYGPMNAMYNISAEQVFRYQAKRKKLGSKGEITAAEMVVNLMWTTVAGAIVMQLIQGIDADDDPKEKAKDLAWEIGGQIAGQVPFARDAYSAIKYGNSFDTPLGGMIKAPFEFGRQAWQGDMDKGMVRAVTGLASFWHIPGGVQLTKSWGYIYEMNDNEIHTFSPYELLVTGK
jgi:hypothetical protein